MNGPDHYREAERLLDEATSRGDFNPRAQWCLELAKLHTALAHVAATAQASDRREWVRVAAWPQRVTERAVLWLVLEQRNGHLNDHARASRDASTASAARAQHTHLPSALCLDSEHAQK